MKRERGSTTARTCCLVVSGVGCSSSACTAWRGRQTCVTLCSSRVLVSRSVCVVALWLYSCVRARVLPAPPVTTTRVRPSHLGHMFTSQSVGEGRQCARTLYTASSNGTAVTYCSSFGASSVTCIRIHGCGQTIHEEHRGRGGAMFSRKRSPAVGLSPSSSHNDTTVRWGRGAIAA